MEFVSNIDVFEVHVRRYFKMMPQKKNISTFSNSNSLIRCIDPAIALFPGAGAILDFISPFCSAFYGKNICLMYFRKLVFFKVLNNITITSRQIDIVNKIFHLFNFSRD